MERVILFIDYQNAYRGARDIFFETGEGPSRNGQFDPLKLGLLLAERSAFERELVGVRVYRGLPSPERDPRGHAAARSQISRWQQDARVTVITRPLKYPKGRNDEGLKPSEKGIDVQLAVDFATMAIRGQYDTGILMSRDTDLLPALEFVASPDVRARCETATWRHNKKHFGRLTIDGSYPYCHWIDGAAFATIADDSNYARGAEPN